MRYRLRTLLIVLGIGPPLMAWGWSEYHWRKIRRDLETSLSTNATNWASMGMVPPEMWRDLTSKRHPIIQVDLANQDQPAH